MTQFFVSESQPLFKTIFDTSRSSPWRHQLKLMCSCAASPLSEANLIYFTRIELSTWSVSNTNVREKRASPVIPVSGKRGMDLLFL